MMCPYYNRAKRGKCSVMPKGIQPSDKHILNNCLTSKCVNCAPFKIAQLEPKEPKSENVVFS